MRNSFRDEPRLSLTIRDPRAPRRRTADSWPRPETQWTRYYLDAVSKSMATEAGGAAGCVPYEALDKDVTFLTTSFTSDT